MLEQLLKKTQFKKEAGEIARRLEQAGFTLDNLDNAPAIFGFKLYGHSTYQVIAAIREAQVLPADEPTKKSIGPVDEPAKE